jgi:hypothetical protein
MSDSNCYVHFHSSTMDPCSPLKTAYVEATSTWLCAGCVRPKPDVGPVDAHIQERAPEGPLNFLSGCGVPLARKSFLFAFGDERIKRDLRLGEVFGPDGHRLDDWVTFRGKRRLIVRGSKHASYRVCPNCGRDVYFAMGTRYLYPEPPKNVELFESDLGGLILPESIATELNIGELAGVTCERLKALGQPKDGLPPVYF